MGKCVETALLAFPHKAGGESSLKNKRHTEEDFIDAEADPPHPRCERRQTKRLYFSADVASFLSTEEAPEASDSSGGDPWAFRNTPLSLQCSPAPNMGLGRAMTSEEREL